MIWPTSLQEKFIKKKITKIQEKDENSLMTKQKNQALEDDLNRL
jgi:hypothetical protein